MDVRIFVTGESDKANFAGSLRVHHCFIGSAIGENAIRIVEANNLMMLHQVEVIRLKTFETGFDLPLRDFFGAAIDLRHEKNFLPVPIFQRLAHVHFAAPFVVVPTVVHEGNAAIDGGANQANALILAEPMLRDVETTHTNRGNRFSGASEWSIEHVS